MCGPMDSLQMLVLDFKLGSPPTQAHTLGGHDMGQVMIFPEQLSLPSGKALDLLTSSALLQQSLSKDPVEIYNF